jgi:hypothetical protein
VTSATPDSGTGITGGGSGYAAIWRTGMSSVRYGIWLGDLKNKHPTERERFFHTGVRRRKYKLGQTKQILGLIS